MCIQKRQTPGHNMASDPEYPSEASNTLYTKPVAQLKMTSFSRMLSYISYHYNVNDFTKPVLMLWCTNVSPGAVFSYKLRYIVGFDQSEAYYLS